MYKVGQEFEDVIMEKMGVFSRETWGKGCLKYTTNTLLDKNAGTDCILKGVPIDITLDYPSKRQTRRLSTMEFGFGSVTFGLRIGNGRIRFDTPVLVIGFDVILPKQYLVNTVDYMSKDFKEIFEVGMNLYLDTIKGR